MEIEQFLFRLGIPTYRTQIKTPIPTDVSDTFDIIKQMPTGIGFIYGISTLTDGVLQDGSTLITSAEAQLLYVSFKVGNTDFMEFVRVDEFQYKFSGVPVQNQPRYLRVNIPKETALDKSYYQNPTGIVSPAAPAKPKTIVLNLWYISDFSYKGLLDRGIINEKGEFKNMQK